MIKFGGSDGGALPAVRWWLLVNGSGIIPRGKSKINYLDWKLWRVASERNENRNKHGYKVWVKPLLLFLDPTKSSANDTKAIWAVWASRESLNISGGAIARVGLITCLGTESKFCIFAPVDNYRFRSCLEKCFWPFLPLCPTTEILKDVLRPSDGREGDTQSHVLERGDLLM